MPYLRRPTQSMALDYLLQSLCVQELRIALPLCPPLHQQLRRQLQGGRLVHGLEQLALVVRQGLQREQLRKGFLVRNLL